MAAVAAPAAPVANGHSNGSANKGGAPDTYSQITILQEAAPKYERKISQLRTSFTERGETTTRITIDDFLDYVAGERLRRIPHQGGRWDRVLKWAEYFANQLSHFEQIVHGFLKGSSEASEVAYVSLRALLDLGPHQAQALERAFRIFYEEGVTLSFFIRHQELFDIGVVRQELAHSYLSLIHLVVDIAFYYNRKARETKSGSVQINLTRQFGREIREFFRRKDRAANAMWSYRLERSPEAQNNYVEISTLRTWLGAASSGLPVSISNPKAERAEFSCEWFQSHLSDFIRGKDDMLSIEGQAGSGKSVLSSWIAERLQRPIGRRYIEGIGYFLDANIPSKSSSLNLVKGLLLQVLEREVGDVTLYQSLVQVYELSTRSGTSSEIEAALWEVLDHAVSKANDMVLIVDGVNEVVGPEGTAKRIFDSLHSLATKYFGVRVITASQGAPTQYTKTKHFTLKPEHTRTDIYNLARHFLSTHHHISEDDADLDKIAHDIAAKSEGSFVTANLLLYLLAREQNKQSIFDVLKKNPNVDVVLQTLVDRAITNPQAKTIISWLLVSEDSLTLDEIRLLLETDVSKGTKVPFVGDVAELLKPADALVVIQDGSVRFRHLSISEHLRVLASSGKSLIAPQAANLDLLSRILLHIKLSLTRDEEPSVEGIEPQIVSELYHDIPLLSYAIRHWTTHFRRTTLYKDNGAHSFTPEFRTLFPNVTIFPLLEKTTWESSISLTEVIHLHELALIIRESILGRHDKSVLQSYLNVATVYEKTGQSKQATKYFYHSFQISKTVLGESSTLTVLFATSYWNLVKSTTVTKRDDLANSKEETLKYLVAHEERENDSTSSGTLGYKALLAGLYKSISESSKASTLYRQIHEANVKNHGHSSKEAMASSREVTISIAKEGKHEEIVPYTQDIFKSAEKTMHVSDERRVEATYQMADAYEAQKDFYHAEEMYITLWQQIAQNTTKIQSSESHAQLIDIVLKYVAFLRRHKRDQEASSILMGLWSEYEKKDIKSDAVAGRLTTVGRELKTLGVASVAVSIFASLWSYFKTTNRQSSKEAADVAIQLTNTAKDAPDTTGGTNYASILMEVFNSTFSGTKSVTIDASTIHTSETLSKYHVQQGHWNEAAEICARVLASLWVSLSKFQSPEKFPDNFSKEAVDIAIREAYCRWKLSQIEHAEKIYLYVFRAAKSSLKVEDERLTTLVETILDFYKQTHQTDKLIAFYEELITTYRKSLGGANTKTITTLYALAALLVKSRKESRAVEIYLEIINALNKDSKICHQDAFDAAIAVSNIYYDSENTKQSQSIFALLWATITARAKDYGVREEFVKTTYERYVEILKIENKADYATLRALAQEYRSTAIAVYGAQSEAAVQATLLLAEVSASSKDTAHQQEAITLYEESFKNSEKSKISNRGLLSLLSSARGKLSSLYIANATTNAANSEKAVDLYKDQYTQNRTQYGWSHHSTLDSVRGLITLWTKSKSPEKTVLATKELKTTTTSVISSEKDPKALYDSAITLGETYVSAGLFQQGWDLLQELRRQIIYRDFSQSSKYDFKVENINRSSYVFLSTFEESLQGKEKTSFSVIMTDLLTESVLHEQYHSQLTKNTRIDLMLLTGARLREFLIRKKRTEQVKNIENELFERFLKALGAEIKTPREVTFRFFVIMLEELAKETHSAHLGNAACNGGNNRVEENLKEGKFQEAFDLATAVFSFVHAHRGYHHAGNVGSGFKLSLYMAGRGVPKPAEGKLRNDMITLSQAILRDTLDACKHLKVEFVKMQPAELNDLVALMGEQKNYVDLEWLLTQLWDSRHEQVSWSNATIISIGRRLVEVRFAHGHKEKAIHLAQDICYNLRQVWGPLDKTTVELNNLLSSLFTAAGRHAEAMAVHEALLREEVSDDNEAPVDAASAEIVATQLDLLKRTFQRNGKFDKDASIYTGLWEELSAAFGKQKAFSGLQAPASWNAKEAPDATGTFVTPTVWEITIENAGQHKNFMHKRRQSGYKVLLNGGISSPSSPRVRA